MKRTALLFSLALPLLMACADTGESYDQEVAADIETNEWQVLFDGSSFDAWRGYQQEEMAPGWEIVDDVMTIGSAAQNGDLVTKQTFANFELEFEWMVPEAGNSGVMFRVTEDHDAPYATGPEYQILDDEHHTGGEPSKNSAGSNYDIHVPTQNVVNPHGQWNTGRIIANGPHVEHWLNGAKIVEYELWNDQWKADVAASKWINFPDYGLRESGHIALQGDHTPVSFRNIRIRDL